MKKKNWFLIIIVLVAGLLIAVVIWIYSKRIEQIESKMNISAIPLYRKLLQHIFAGAARKMMSTSLLVPKVAFIREIVWTVCPLLSLSTDDHGITDPFILHSVETAPGHHNILMKSRLYYLDRVTPGLSHPT